MDWLLKTVGTSVGKKLLMALTGLAFCGFLAAHLAGNLTLYGGADAFNSYAEHLHSLGPLIAAISTSMSASNGRNSSCGKRTDSMAPAGCACINRARADTSFNPSSIDITPARQAATNSPTL